ncbi:hypothetical protein KFE98_18425 [bacterium SCSIO 12741]|nr:hypothetical protein KFE98_18425 [bacterium SCSIO 12741]
MKNWIQRIQLAALVMVFAWIASGCSKEKIGPGKLKGKTYTVQDVAVYEGTNYATWKNTHEGGTMDGGLNVTSSEGFMAFSDDGIADFNITVTITGSDGQASNYQHVNAGGSLVMDGRQDWFDIDGGTLGYEQYFIQERKGKELIVVWENLHGQYGEVFFFKVKR